MTAWVLPFLDRKLGAGRFDHDARASLLNGQARIDLRRQNGSVSEDFLDLANVGAAGDQNRSHRVPQRMRRDMALDLGETNVLLENVFDRVDRQTQPVAAAEVRRRVGLSLAPPAGLRGERAQSRRAADGPRSS